MAQVTGWNNIQVIHHGQLTVVTGTVGIDMHTNKTRDFDREKLVFVVPADNQGNPLPIDQPGPVTVIVYPATYENRGGNPSGCGVDDFSITLIANVFPNIAQVTASLALEGGDAYFLRVGFMVIIG